MLERGEVASISDLARRLEVDSSYIGRTLRLTTLAPDISWMMVRNDNSPSRPATDIFAATE